MSIKNDMEKFLGQSAEKALSSAKSLRDLLVKAQEYKPQGFLNCIRKPVFYDDEMIMRHEYYKGKMKADLICTLQHIYPKSYHKMMPYSLRLVSKYINRAANLYINSPERKLFLGDTALDDTDNNIVMFNRFVSLSKYNRYFKQQNRFTRLFKTSFGRVKFDNELDCPKWELFPPYAVERVPHPDKPSDINSDLFVFLKLSSVKGFYSNSIQSSDRFECWYNIGFDDNNQAQWQRVIVSGDNLEVDDNVYEWLPITVLYDDEPNEPFINSGDDIIDVSRAMNVLLTYAKFISQYQAHSQLVLKTDNPKGDSQLAVGADKVTPLPTSDTLEVLDFNPKMLDLVSMGKDLIYLFAIMNNMSPNQFRVDRQALTGVALKVENLDLMEDRQDKIVLFNDYEQEHFHKTVLCQNLFGSKQYSDNLEMHFVVGDPDIISDDEAKIRIWQQEKREGVSDNIQWVMEKYNVSEKEAGQYLDALKARKSSDTTDNFFESENLIKTEEETIE